MYIMFRCEDIGRCRVVEKNAVLGSRFVGGIPQISNMHFQIAVTSDHAAIYGGSVQRARRLDGEKKKKEDKEEE